MILEPGTTVILAWPQDVDYKTAANPEGTGWVVYSVGRDERWRILFHEDSTSYRVEDPAMSGTINARTFRVSAANFILVPPLEQLAECAE